MHTSTAPLIFEAQLINDTMGVALAEPCISPSDPAGPQTRATNAELTARFERDAIPRPQVPVGITKLGLSEGTTK
jgi:hypothetical protein